MSEIDDQPKDETTPTPPPVEEPAVGEDTDPSGESVEDDGADDDAGRATGRRRPVRGLARR